MYAVKSPYLKDLTGLESTRVFRCARFAFRTRPEAAPNRSCRSTCSALAGRRGSSAHANANLDSRNYFGLLSSVKKAHRLATRTAALRCVPVCEKHRESTVACACMCVCRLQVVELLWNSCLVVSSASHESQ